MRRPLHNHAVRGLSYQYRDSHYKDKTVSRRSYFYNETAIPGKAVFILNPFVKSRHSSETFTFLYSIFSNTQVCRRVTINKCWLSEQLNSRHCWQIKFDIKSIKKHIYSKSYIYLLKPFFLKRIRIGVHILTRQIWGIWKLRPAYSPETPNLGQNRWCFVPCDLEIWWMTLENNRAPLLCCSKLWATFHSHRWIQTGVAVWKRPIWIKFDDF